MKRLASMFALAGAAAALGGCASLGGGWTTLVDGTKGMDNFNVVGQADWTGVDGAIQATKGGTTPSYLVTKSSYKDFTIRVEFWASDEEFYKHAAKTPRSNCILDSSKLAANGINMRSCADALLHALQNWTA